MKAEFLYKELATYIEECDVENNYDCVALMVRTSDGREYKGGYCKINLEGILTDHVLTMYILHRTNEYKVFIDVSSIIMFTFEFKQ